MGNPLLISLSRRPCPIHDNLTTTPHTSLNSEPAKHRRHPLFLTGSTSTNRTEQLALSQRVEAASNPIRHWDPSSIPTALRAPDSESLRHSIEKGIMLPPPLFSLILLLLSHQTSASATTPSPSPTPNPPIPTSHITNLYRPFQTACHPTELLALAPIPYPPTTTTPPPSSPNTQPLPFQNILKRSTGCGTQHANCATIGYPALCCTTTAVCSADQAGAVAW